MEKDRGKQWRRTGLFIYCVQGKKKASPKRRLVRTEMLPQPQTNVCSYSCTHSFTHKHTTIRQEEDR